MEYIIPHQSKKVVAYGALILELLIEARKNLLHICSNEYSSTYVENSRSIEELMLSRPNKSEAQLLGIIYWKPRCMRPPLQKIAIIYRHVFHCVSIDYFSSEKSYRSDKIPHPLDIRWLLYQSSVLFSTHILDRKHKHSCASEDDFCLMLHRQFVLHAPSRRSKQITSGALLCIAVSH